MSCWINGNKCSYGFENFVNAKLSFCKECHNKIHEEIDDDISCLVSEFDQKEAEILYKTNEFLMNHSEEFLVWLKERRAELERYLTGEEKTNMGYEVVKDKLEEIESVIESIRDF